jgi:hypothetical protein
MTMMMRMRMRINYLSIIVGVERINGDNDFSAGKRRVRGRR